MDLTSIQLMQGASGASGETTYVDDVFSTYLYKGNDSTITVNNGIDLSTEGGLVWTKTRNTSYNHFLFDTARGTQTALSTSLNNANFNETKGVTSFNTNGFTIGGSGGDGGFNASGTNYNSWTFRKAPGFFDVVTWTGNSDTNQTISHSLKSRPGMIIAKRTDSSTTGDWVVYHRDHAGYLKLNSTNAAVSDSGAWTPVTSTSFKAYDLSLIHI